LANFIGHYVPEVRFTTTVSLREIGGRSQGNYLTGLAEVMRKEMYE
jgi:hypothetical protein